MSVDRAWHQRAAAAGNSRHRRPRRRGDRRSRDRLDRVAHHQHVRWRRQPVALAIEDAHVLEQHGRHLGGRFRLCGNNAGRSKRRQQAEAHQAKQIHGWSPPTEQPPSSVAGRKRSTEAMGARAACARVAAIGT